MAFRCYSYALYVVNLIYGSDTFRSMYICIFFFVSTHYSSSNDMASCKLGLLVRPLFPGQDNVCHYCHTIDLHSTSTLRTTPSSFAVSRAIINLAFVGVSVIMLNIGTHQIIMELGTFFHLIVPPYNSKQIA
jgi:hypothetical protein